MKGLPTEEQILESIRKFEADPRPLWMKLTPCYPGQHKSFINCAEAFSEPLTRTFENLMSGWSDAEYQQDPKDDQP